MTKRHTVRQKGPRKFVAFGFLTACAIVIAMTSCTGSKRLAAKTILGAHRCNRSIPVSCESPTTRNPAHGVERQRGNSCVVTKSLEFARRIGAQECQIGDVYGDSFRFQGMQGLGLINHGLQRDRVRHKFIVDDGFLSVGGVVGSTQSIPAKGQVFREFVMPLDLCRTLMYGAPQGVGLPVHSMQKVAI